MEFSIRPLAPEDAEDVEQLYQQSAAYLRSVGDKSDFQFNADVFRRDGFSKPPAFSGIGAVRNGELIGYLLYTFGYDTDRAIRYLFVLDLLVDQAVRLQGIGKALMGKAASLCKEAGGRELFWAVYVKNEPASNFYGRLGAEEIHDLQFMRLKIDR